MTWPVSAIEAFRRRYGAVADAALGAVQWHPHDAADISGAFESLTLRGDFWSTDWDGAVPADLSAGRDLTATQGFYIDTSAGVAQFMGLYWDVGTVSPLAAAETWLWDSGGSLPTSQAQIAATDVSRGIVAGLDYLVDMTVVMQVSGVAAGRDWWAQCEVQGSTRGLAIFGSRVAASGTVYTGYESQHTHSEGTLATGGASVGHTHTVDLTSGNADATHGHNPGTLAISGGATNTGYESSHTHSGPNHFHTAGTYFDSVDYHAIAGVSANAGTGSTGAGSSHRHSIPDHTHTVSGATAQSGTYHKHSVTGSTGGQSQTHTHGIAGTTSSGSAHRHSYSLSLGLARGQVAVRWVGTVTADGAGIISLGVQAATQVSAATVDRVQIAYMIWNAPVPPRVELVLLRPVSLFEMGVANAA